MTAAWLFATVVTGTPGAATVDLGGVERDVPVSLGRTLAAGEVAVLLRDGRRLVCLGRVAS